MADLELFDESTAEVVGFSGRVFGERFQLGGVVATDAAAAQYEARDLATGDTVVLRLVELGSPDLQSEFTDAAERLGALSHKHVAALVGSGIEYGFGFVATRPHPGRPLSALARDMPLPPISALDVVMQVCRGVKALHGEGRVHGRLCPECVHVVEADDGDRKVVVSGAMLVESEVANDVENDAARPYRAPELDEDWAPSERSDVFAVGALMYLALTGSAPPLMADREASLADDAPSFSEADPETRVSPMLEWVAQTCMHSNPAERFRNISELRRALLYCAENLDGSLMEQLRMRLEDGIFVPPSASPDGTAYDPLAGGYGGTTAELAAIGVQRRRDEMAKRSVVVGVAIAVGVLLLVAVVGVGVLVLEEDPVVESSISVE